MFFFFVAVVMVTEWIYTDLGFGDEKMVVCCFVVVTTNGGFRAAVVAAYLYRCAAG